MSASDPQQWALAGLDDTEAALSEAFVAAEDWDYDRLTRALDDIVAIVETIRRGPQTEAAAAREAPTRKYQEGTEQ